MAATAAGVGLVAYGAATWPRATPLKKVRQELVRELALAKHDKKRVSGLVAELVQKSQLAPAKFDEQLLGGGQWKVVHCEGPLSWEELLFSTPEAKAVQEFQPAGRHVVSRGQLGPWEALCVVAEGSYEPLQLEGQAAAQTIKTNFTSGALHAWGHRIPLPLRREALVTLAYTDDGLRVFKSSGGAVTVQLREDLAASLLAQ